MATTRFSRSAAKLHIASLLKQHSIAVRWLSGPDWMVKAQAFETAWTVYIPHPNSRKQYLVALHEIGHLLGDITPKHTLPIPVGVGNVVEEASAWYWALTHIPPELDASIEKPVVDALLAQTLVNHMWHAALSAGGQAVPD